MLQCVVVCCMCIAALVAPHTFGLSVAVGCSVFQLAAVCFSWCQCVAVGCSVLQCVAVGCSVLQCVAVCCSLRHRAGMNVRRMNEV